MDLMKRVLLAALSLGGLAAAGSAQAQSPATGSLTVNATVPANCELDSPTLAFGTTVDVLAATDTDASATINVTCTTGTAYEVALDDGTNFSTVRRMEIGTTGSFLTYELYRDASRTQRFGSIVAERASGTGQGSSADAILVYGRIPQGQTTAAVGAYTDTVGISVTW